MQTAKSKLPPVYNIKTSKMTNIIPLNNLVKNEDNNFFLSRSKSSFPFII